MGRDHYGEHVAAKITFHNLEDNAQISSKCMYIYIYMWGDRT